MVKRYDKVSANLGKLQPDKDGFLKIDNAYATKAGVLVYKTTDGRIVRELRPRDEVFKPESMNSLTMKPFTVEHRGGIVKSKDIAKYSAGSVGSTAREDGLFVGVPIGVHRKDAVDKIVKDGILELSAGYECEIEEKSGVDPEFGAYDRIQRNIRYNHLTVTKMARADGCAIRLDGADAVLEFEQKQSKEAMTVKIKSPKIQVGEQKFDSQTYTVPEEAEAAVTELSATLELVAEEANNRLDAMQAKLDGQAKELEEALAKSKESEEKLDSAIPKEELAAKIKEMADLQNMAKSYKVDRFDSLDEFELKKGIALKNGYNEEKLDSDAYLDAALDQIRAKKNPEAKLDKKETFEDLNKQNSTGNIQDEVNELKKLRRA
jgi:hypothetical protein